MINSVTTERKRKKATTSSKQAQKIKDIKHKNARKVTRSLYAQEAPMAGVTIENRIRGESNYTARSGDNGLRENSHEDRDSLSSGGMKRKFKSSRMKKTLESSAPANQKPSKGLQLTTIQ